MATTTRALNLKSVQSINNKRILVSKAKAGAKIRFTVQGDGNWMDVQDKEGNFVMSATDNGVILRKKIFNLQATSEIAQKNPIFVKLLIDALKAERKGDVEAASDLYNEYLNKTQISFSVLDNQAVLAKIVNGVDISARVQLITTENGELLTIDPSTISVIEPEILKTAVFDLSALTGLSEDELDALEDAPEDKKAETAAERRAREKKEAAAKKATA